MNLPFRGVKTWPTAAVVGEFSGLPSALSQGHFKGLSLDPILLPPLPLWCCQSDRAEAWGGGRCQELLPLVVLW